MRNIFLNTWVICGLVILISTSSVVYSAFINDFIWLSRSGSVITIFGLLLTLKHNILSENRDIDSIVKEKNHYANNSPKDSDLYKEHVKYARKVIADEYIGLSLTIVGTFIWGYGDLFNCF